MTYTGKPIHCIPKLTLKKKIRFSTKVVFKYLKLCGIK